MSIWHMKSLMTAIIWTLVTHIMAASPGVHAASAGCKPVRRALESSHDRIWPRFPPVTRAGRYCVSEDLQNKIIFDIASGGYADSMMPMWALEAGPSVIDLRGHQLSTNQPYEAISVSAKDVSIVNGIVRAGAVIGIKLTGYRLISLHSDYTVLNYKDDLLEYAYLRDVGALTGSGRTSIPRGELHLDRMRIEAGASNSEPFGAIGIGGVRSDNSVTNSSITVVHGHAGIYLFGARQRIEGNTIVLKCPSAAPSAAPIKLHAADNSVIRNNTIVVDCWFGKPDAAISLIDSRNVLIENNRIIGVKQLYKIWDERPEQRSSVIERGNRFPTIWDRILRR